MFYHQTIFEYMDNPMGKGSTAIANRGLIKTNLDQRYEKLIYKHHDFKCNRYFDGNNFYFHILIPSESERNNNYDVVIELSDPLGDFTKDITLNRYVMRVFSNCPSFVFTYAYVFNKYGMLIDALKDKYTDMIFDNSPNVKNPGEIINFEKSIYFACKYLSSHKTLLNKLTLANTSSIGMKRTFEKIRNTDTILKEIKKENNRINEEKKTKNKSNVHKTSKSDNVHKVNVVNRTTGSRRVTPHAKLSKIKPKKKIK